MNPDADEDCEDGADNDCDGLADCEDGDCASACSESDCADEVDNDGDGDTDCDDSDCWGTTACPRVLAARVTGGDGFLQFYSKVGWQLNSLTARKSRTELYGSFLNITGVASIGTSSVATSTCTWQVDRVTFQRVYHYKGVTTFSGNRISGYNVGSARRSGVAMSSGCQVQTSGWLPTYLLAYQGELLASRSWTLHTSYPIQWYVPMSPSTTSSERTFSYMSGAPPWSWGTIKTRTEHYGGLTTGDTWTRP